MLWNAFLSKKLVYMQTSCVFRGEVWLLHNQWRRREKGEWVPGMAGGLHNKGPDQNRAHAARRGDLAKGRRIDYTQSSKRCGAVYVLFTIDSGGMMPWGFKYPKDASLCVSIRMRYLSNLAVESDNKPCLWVLISKGMNLVRWFTYCRSRCSVSKILE